MSGDVPYSLSVCGKFSILPESSTGIVLSSVLFLGITNYYASQPKWSELWEVLALGNITGNKNSTKVLRDTPGLVASAFLWSYFLTCINRL